MSPARRSNADESGPRGTIVDTNSKGRFDLVVFDDGILAVRGGYVGVMLQAAGPGLVGLGGAAFAPAAAAGIGAGLGASTRDGHETKRVARSLAAGREAALRADARNHFIPSGDLEELRLKKRWYGHSLTVVTPKWPNGRTYAWKPALNDFRAVRHLLIDTWPFLVKIV